MFEAEESPAGLPFVAPPRLASESWIMRSAGPGEPRFPYLPGEERGPSLSVGDVTTGFLVNARALPLPHPRLAILPRQFERRFHYTSDEMAALVEDGAAHVAAAYPDAVLYLGNFSRHGGGAIPHSVSHNSGRDADIAFFALDEAGAPATPPDLLRFGQDGWFRGANHLTEEELAGREERDKVFWFPDLALQFDVERNWRFVEGLILSEAAQLQFIFVSNPLRAKLLAEGRRQGASAAVMREAAQVLIQPAGALPHDDHFHLRIHCTARDLAAGCVETGRPPARAVDQQPRRDAVRAARGLLRSDDEAERRVGLERLSLLREVRQAEALRALADEDPGVRIAAVQALVGDSRAATTSALLARLEVEEHPNVFVELVNELSGRGSAAVEPLISALQRDVQVDLGAAGRLSSRALVADALARQEAAKPVPYIIDAMTDSGPSTRRSLDRSLRLLTNQRVEVGDAESFADAWQSWWDEHGDKPREAWMKQGFQEAGFAVTALGPEAVWELCRAIMSEPHLSFNAQRTLMRIADHHPPSLRWSPWDASFHWRRWFERRQEELRLPPIPEELSTAAGYQPEPED